LIASLSFFLSIFRDEMDVFAIVIVVVIGRLLASVANESETGPTK